jgi:hypothetical protein
MTPIPFPPTDNAERYLAAILEEMRQLRQLVCALSDKPPAPVFPGLAPLYGSDEPIDLRTLDDVVKRTASGAAPVFSGQTSPTPDVRGNKARRKSIPCIPVDTSPLR